MKTKTVFKDGGWKAIITYSPNESAGFGCGDLAPRAPTFVIY